MAEQTASSANDSGLEDHLNLLGKGVCLNDSLHIMVPNKSILKKTSSYGDFDATVDIDIVAKRKPSFRSFARDCSSSSHGQQDGNNALNVSLHSGEPKTKTHIRSYLSVASSNLCNGSKSSQVVSMANSTSNEADRAGGKDSSDRRRCVSFRSVAVREYDRTIGDHPSCRSGPPISLDWSYSNSYEKNLEEYEAERLYSRAKETLCMNKYKRKILLAVHWGHTSEELKEARRNTKKIQRQRNRTNMLQPVHHLKDIFICSI
mmetsp:Transcript_27433/g.46693  ORF Transcript_27433/g.46693 Transcript_27433/m.46693 type:complete len:261 (-) Transcript_27433:314-1096(-)